MKKQLFPNRPESQSRVRFLPVLAWAGLLIALVGAGVETNPPKPAAPSFGLYAVTNIHTVHLTLTAEQWAALEPQGGSGPGGEPGGPGGGPGGPGRAGRPAPAALFALVFLKQGDTDGDGSLSRAEFAALGVQWFAAWDTNHAGFLDNSQVATGLEAVLRSSGTNLPGGPGGAGGPNLVGSAGKRNGLAAASGVDFAYVHAALEFDDTRLADVSLRYKGNNTFMQSRNSVKRSFKVDLNRGFPGRKLEGVTKLNLHNNVNDASWMNEVLSHRLFRDAGVPASGTAYARVYVTVPGQYDRQYFGLYSLVENVDNRFAVDRFGTKKGALFKPVTRQLFEDVGDDWSSYQQAYDAKTEVGREETDHVMALSRLVSHATDADFAAQIGNYLDLDEFARFMAVTAWLSTMDSLLSMGQNFVVYLHPKTHKFQFIPWDLDNSFGQFPMAGSSEQLTSLSIHHPWSGDLRFLDRVFAVAAFKEMYLARLREFSTTIFRPARIQAQVDELAGGLRSAVKEESTEKLARFESVVAGKSVAGDAGSPPGGDANRTGGPSRRGGPGGGPPGGPGGRAMNPIKTFVVARAHSVVEQLAGKSEGYLPTQRGPGGAGERPGFAGPGGPGGFGPGRMLASAMVAALDSNQDGKLSEAEFTGGFARWYQTWTSNSGGSLSADQLRAGIGRDFNVRGRPDDSGPPPDDDR